MNREYLQLDLGTLIGYRIVQDMMIAQPQFGVDSALHSIFGKLDLMVKMPETVNNLDINLVITGSDTTMRLFDSEKGYYWSINY